MTDVAVAIEPTKAPKGVDLVRVLSVRHWTDKTFSFAVERPRSFRFRSGEFAMIGLVIDGKPLLRAYSMASPAWDEKLEFYSIKVADGPLTKHLQKIRPGDQIALRPKPTGTLVHDALSPASRLLMISTGTGIAPFASLVRDPETFEKFDQVILTQTCREQAELAYGRHLIANLKDDPLIGDLVGGHLTHVASTTREQSRLMGRITDLIASGDLFAHIPGGPLNPETDRVMICGSMDMLKDVKALCEAAGFVEGSNNQPAQFVVERAFVG